MAINFNVNISSGVDKSHFLQNAKIATQKNSSNCSSKISSCEGSSKSQSSSLSIIFSPIIYLWNLIFNRSSLPHIDQMKIIEDCSALYQIKQAIENKNSQSFNEAYNGLSKDAKKLLQNIFYRSQFNNMIVIPALNMDRHIKENPFHYDLASSCDKASDNLGKLLKLKSFVEVLRNSTLASDENIRLVDQFALLPYDLRDGIKHTIWKVLNPQNNNDYDFGGTILKKHATDPFIKDIVTAAVKGLQMTDDCKQWYLEMPNGWKTRKNFTI